MKTLNESSIVSNIIIVDNSNELQEFTLHESESDKLKLVLNQSNRGFAAAANQGLRYCETEWLLLINPDVRLDEENIQHLVQGAVQYDSPLAGPRFYWDDEMIFRLPPATGSCQWMNYADHCAGRHIVDATVYSFYWSIRNDQFWNARKPFFEPFLSGACLLINKPWVEQLEGKLFDERFFLYFEDTDLCTRAMMNGVSPLCIPDARVVHYYNQSPTDDAVKQELMAKSSQFFLEKYYGGIEYSDESFKKKTNIHHFVDLGNFDDSPPVFKETLVQERKYTFEIAVTPHFVPFAQAVILHQEDIAIPHDIWERLSPGVYYSRIRSETDILKLWQWKKK